MNSKTVRNDREQFVPREQTAESATDTAAVAGTTEESEMEYRVVWEIDISADSPREAAEKALAIQRDPNSTATVFDVTDEGGEPSHIDLLEV
jgi:hypothetical protein